MFKFQRETVTKELNQKYLASVRSKKQRPTFSHNMTNYSDRWPSVWHSK